MDNIPEREQSKSERVISLGEKFQPFDPRYLTKNRFDSSIILNMGNRFKIPFKIDAIFIYEENYRGNVLLPFGPEEESYPINSEDFDYDMRLKKLERMSEELDKFIDRDKNPIDFLLNARDYELNKLGLNEKHGAEYLPSLEMLDLFKGLRFILDAPKARLEARPNSHFLKEGDVNFMTFYPVDSGPLADTPRYEDREGGLVLSLPSDPEKLAQIWAKFVLAEEEPREANQI